MEFWQNHLALWLGHLAVSLANPNLWSALTAIGTITLAAVTYAIIRQNQFLIQQNRQDQQNAEARHRDQFKPICALIPRDGNLPACRGDLLELIGTEITRQNYGVIHVRCTLRNTGSGPALNLRLTIRYTFDSTLAIPPIELAPLGAGEVRGNQSGNQCGDLGCRLEWPVLLSDGGLNESTFLSLQKGGFEFILDYADVFDQPFRSVHRVAPFEQGQTIPWFTYHQPSQDRAARNQ